MPTVADMRILRNLAVTAVAVCSGLSLFFHFAGLGAVLMGIVVLYVWREEAWTKFKPWVIETCRRIVVEITRHP